MEDLLPLLQDISDNHPESSVQEMAADLRITIATHGAVWSATVRAESEDFRQLKTKVRIDYSANTFLEDVSGLLVYFNK